MSALVVSAWAVSALLSLGSEPGDRGENATAEQQQDLGNTHDQIANARVLASSSAAPVRAG